MIIIPAIDLINGQCVRLTKGDYSTTKVYNSNPLEMAQEFEAAGFTHLHLVDLDGAKAGEVKNWQVLETIAKHTSLKIDFSGGIKSLDAAKKALDFGAEKITIGSLAVKNKALLLEWTNTISTDHIIIGADVMNEYIAIHGWQETSNERIEDFIQFYLNHNFKYFMCTDVSKDGMLQGTATDLYQQLITQFPTINLIASGGVATMNDIETTKTIGCYACIVGKAIYENKISLTELQSFN
ncbi:MAG: 1-(5-phosphoribosyl)-5-[(5-phosphoribosylamino)methylideneamino]imidazole-4-carboxamide isomerase [Chitinophagales bacterium]|nr:1-(5-phosphoribosyl)-5-[(5-phosphoribosylamino)methylideneamino]imidazole-4-carboxamide isomerase [Chitinophagales bacterium]